MSVLPLSLYLSVSASLSLSLSSSSSSPISLFCLKAPPYTGRSVSISFHQLLYSSTFMFILFHRIFIFIYLLSILYSISFTLLASASHILPNSLSGRRHHHRPPM
ncbi:hypothetical protein CI102_8976 [Trichoderma harzianum]|nr:hypothetical protein CI102_8976 [Trichoderma harzianum]